MERQRVHFVLSLIHILIVLIGVVSILTRSLGKYLGAHYSAKRMKCEPQICKYLGITLLPQAGVALGMCVTARQLGAEGDLIRNITPVSYTHLAFCRQRISSGRI